MNVKVSVCPQPLLNDLSRLDGFLPGMSCKAPDPEKAVKQDIGSFQRNLVIGLEGHANADATTAAAVVNLLLFCFFFMYDTKIIYIYDTQI